MTFGSKSVNNVLKGLAAAGAAVIGFQAGGLMEDRLQIGDIGDRLHNQGDFTND